MGAETIYKIYIFYYFIVVLTYHIKGIRVHLVGWGNMREDFPQRTSGIRVSRGQSLGT